MLWATQAGATDHSVESPPAVAPPAGWITPHFFDPGSLTTPVESGEDQHWLLQERQINASENETFCHVIRQVLTVSGVQNGASLTLDFNPVYESLTLHWVRIWRGTDHLDRLDASKVKLIRRERDLDQNILTGEQSAVLVLEDVRVNDILDYAYTLKGANPIFGGRAAFWIPVQKTYPVERLLTRILWPTHKRIFARTHACSVQPVAVSKKDGIEYTWDLRQVPGFPVEDSLPAWYDPQPWVQLSEYKTWVEVNQWALGLFQSASPLSPELQQKIAEWKRLAGPEQQVSAVLQFVQDDIRYFGLEIGVNSEKPAEPSSVFTRRYGDCKDKALLFVTILRALGIEAYPVLLNTEARHTIEDWQPSAGAFDHCIAVVRCGDQAYWLDPTMGYQRGPLANHYLPDYGRGLVVSPGTTGLATIPRASALTQTATTEYFQLGRRTESSSLKIVTVSDGCDAEVLRALFATNRRSEIEKRFTQFYSGLYPGIKMSAPIEIKDDEVHNQIRTTEYYTLPQAWVQVDKSDKYRCDIYPSAIAALLKKPASTERKMPLAVSFPEHQILRTEVTLPNAWSVDPENKTISDPAFFFQKTTRGAGNKLIIQYEYRSLADAVSSDGAARYIQHLAQALESLGVSLTWQ
jgi:transglutaminase-like putative cysteine protease